MALKEVHPEVRSQVASSAKRLPAQDALPLIHHLLQSPADADDPDIPLLIWWAIESKMEENMHEVISMFEEPQLWKNPTVEKMIINRVMQRLAMAGTDETFTACARLINLAPTRKNAALLIGGLQEGLIGKDQVSFPPVLTQALRPYESEMGEAPLTLALRRGEAQALRQA